MILTPLRLLLFSGLTLVSTLGLQAETLTYPDLVHRLTDLEHISTRPPVGEIGALASSYDRASEYDAATDTYKNWGANGDGGGIIRQEGDVSVFAEIKGPGVIWRTWSATADNGHVKIYLDGAETPTVDLPFSGYFDGKNAPFTRPNLVYKTEANGLNNYTPIPFLKSCKIVADKNWGGYFQFNYTQFPAGTIVPTFKLPLSDADSAALDEADKTLGNCGVDPAGVRPGQQVKTAAVTVKPGEKAVVADLTGAGAITALKAKFPLPTDPEEQKNFLRQLVVQITWDDDKTPSVWAPIGDFFADAVIPAHYKSLPTGYTEDNQWYCYWYMPYASKAHIEVQNDSAAPVTMNWEVTHAPLTKPIASLLRFHAKWHRDAFMPERKDREPDWTLLVTQGAGRFVGTQLHIWNPRGDWWGEGDEKWFVDGEKFPSTIGTGSEDYFGYAWSSGKTFNEPLHGQPVNENNNGHISAHRWHIADNIPFQKSFEGAIEKYFKNARPTLYAGTAFWYLNAGGSDPYPEVPVADRIGYWVPLSVLSGPGVIEGETLKVLKGDNMRNQDMTDFGPGWSGGQMFWMNKAPDAHSEFEFTPPKAGKVHFFVRFTKANDYGTVQVSVNGVKVGAPVDCYSEGVVPAEPQELGIIDLPAGANQIQFDIVGKNDKSQGYAIGLDYIKLTPIP